MDAPAADNEQTTTQGEIKNEEKKEEKIQQTLPVEQQQLLEQLTTTTSGGKGAGKKIHVNFDERSKCDQLDNEVTELLGSVTTHNCPGTRTSARVIQKMKQDQSRPLTPPQNEPKKDEKPMQKTPSQLRPSKPIWTNLERNLFFDALNDYGKNFEAIGNFINSKLKRKCQSDPCFKTKDQVRQHYYQTFHKISKYVKFSDEVKKLAQELYTLINFGEMRRRVHFVTYKHFIKLKHLIYQGQLIVRCKGKNMRIKTPSCKALRKLNQLDDSLEDIRLPSKIEVFISPANMTSYCRVQTIAQNPRVRTVVPLHKKLLNLIKTFEYKWRSPEARLAEQAVKMFPSAATDMDTNNSSHKDADMCFLPKPAVVIHRPLLSITEYLSSGNICLTAYEQRMGVNVRGEMLNAERQAKRQRTESGSEKRSPEIKKAKCNNSTFIEKTETNTLLLEERKDENELPTMRMEASSGDELSDEINELLSDVEFQQREETANDASKAPELLSEQSVLEMSSAGTRIARRGNTQQRNARATNIFKPLISEEVMQRIRQGWTVDNAADITIGDLYVVFGQDSKLELEYYWTDAQQPAHLSADLPQTAAESVVFAQKKSGMPYNSADCEDPELLKTLATSTLSNRLKHLLLIGNLSERMRKRQCSCGHTCDRNSMKNRLSNMQLGVANKTYVAHKSVPANGSESGNVFRQPMAPLRKPFFNVNASKEITTLPRQKMPRQMLVQQLMLPGSANRLNGKHVAIAENTVTAAVTPVETCNTEADNSINATTMTTTTTITTAVNTSSNINETDTSTKPTSSGSLSKNITTAETESRTETDAKASTSAEGQLQKVSSFINALDDLEFPPSPAVCASKDVGLCTPTHKADTPDSAFDESSNLSLFSTNVMSPVNLLQCSSSNSRWLNENLHDFSLTSLLGHLDEISGTNDILDPSSNLSVISESSVDYRHKFQEINALIQSQENNTSTE